MSAERDADVEAVAKAIGSLDAARKGSIDPAVYHRRVAAQEALSRLAARLVRAEQERDEAKEVLDGSHARGFREGVRAAEARAVLAETALKEAEKAVVTLGRAAAFYADFEESGHSNWEIAVPACVAVYGRVPSVDDGGDPACYRLAAAPTAEENG